MVWIKMRLRAPIARNLGYCRVLKEYERPKFGQIKEPTKIILMKDYFSIYTLLFVIVSQLF